MRNLVLALCIFVAAPAASAQAWLPGYGQTGWYQFSSATNLTNVCPPNNFNGTSYAWASNCHNVIDAWGGAGYDQAGHRMVIWGGGHNDYPGNEVYTLNLGTGPTDALRGTMNRIAGPTTVTQAGANGPANQGGDCNNGWLSDQTANSRHTYFGITVGGGKLYFTGGGVTCQAGGNTHTAGFFNLSTLAWTPIDNVASFPGSGTVPGACGSCLSNTFNDAVTYNSSNGHIYFENGASASTWEWDGTTSTQRETFNGFASDEVGLVYDQTDNILFEYGGGDLKKTVPGTWAAWANVSCNSTCAAAVAGVSSASWDSVNDVIYFYTGSGSTIYKFAPGSNTWTALATNTNPCQPDAGQAAIYNRFQFDSAYQVGVLVNDATQQACVWWPGPPPNTFDNRSAGINVPGGSGSIVSSHTFDATITLPHCASGPCTTRSAGVGTCTTGISQGGCYFIYYKDQPNSLGNDATNAYDGHTPLKDTILNGYFQGEPGSFEYNFDPTFATQFGAGQEFFLQYSERIDSGMLTNIPNAEGFKQDITTAGDTASVQSQDCSNNPAEIVTIQNGDAGLFPVTYGNCGFSGFTNAFGQSGYQNITLPGLSGPNFLDQNAAGCPHYSGRGVPTTDPTCWNFVAGEWFTVQKHIKIGTFGDSPTSVVEVWLAHQGQPAQLVSNAADAAIVHNGVDTGSGSYGKVSLSAYNTAANWNVNTAVWYANIIVSTRRIPDPLVGTPNAPDSLSLSGVSANSVTVNWRVNSANGTAQDDTGFLVERCSGKGSACFPNPQAGFAQIGSTAAGASSYTDSTVSANTTYTYRVRAKNASGNSGYAIAQCFNGSQTNCGGTTTTTPSGPTPGAPATGMFAGQVTARGAVSAR